VHRAGLVHRTAGQNSEKVIDVKERGFVVRTRRTFCAALLICVATIGQTGAKADTTGKTLLDLCSAPHVGNNAMYFACLTYINGFRDGYRARDVGFPATANAYRSTPETVLVALTDIIPPMRKPAYPKDWRGFERTRLIDLLRGIVADEQIDPVSLIELWPASDPMLSLAYRYSVRDGFHRFYASIIAGFTELPASIQTLSEVLEQSRSFG
jgi:hypothetical protein